MKPSTRAVPASVEPFREAKDVLADGGITPLDVMIGAMRAMWEEAHSSAPGADSLSPDAEDDAGTNGCGTNGRGMNGNDTTCRGERPDPRLRDKALAIAEKVAPYIHPRAKPVDPLATTAEPSSLTIEIVFVKPDSAKPPG